jgi:hypothetical protein
MKAVLRVEPFEDRFVPAIAIDSAYETFAWVTVNTLRQDPAAFADNLDGLRTGSVASAFGFTKSDPIVADLKGMISNAGVPAHYGQALALMRATAPAGPFGWDEVLENRAGNHNEWMKVNGFEHTGVNSGSRSAIPGFTRNNSAPADTWGYSGQFTWYGENIGYSVGSLRNTKAAYNAGNITLAGLQQRAAFLDTVAYMLELNSGSLGHLQNLLGRDSGTHATLPSYNALGIDTDLYEAPSIYENQDGVPEAYLSTQRLGLYRPGGSGGYVAGVVYSDMNSNGYYDVGEGLSVTVDVRNTTGGGFTDTLIAGNHGAFTGYVANGTYTVTISANGVVIDSQTVSINNNNKWAGFALGGLGRPTITAPFGTQASLRPNVSWTAADGATGYQVRIDDRSNSTTDLFNSAPASGTSWTPPTELISGHSYRVWVRATNGEFVGPWSAFSDFSIAVAARVSPGGTVNDVRPTFTWSAIAGADYKLRIDDVTGARTNIFPNVAVGTASWNPTADLISGHTYRWKVRALNDDGVGAWSPAGTFTVGRPTPTAPTTIISNLRPTFSWTAIDDAAMYEVRIKAGSGAQPTIFRQSGLTGLTWTPPGDLVSGRTYFWQVRALNAVGAAKWSPATKFTVAVPVPAGPGGDVTDRTPTLTWSAITGASSFQVKLKNRTTGSIVVATVSGTNWTPAADLIAGHDYRWWVRALNSDDLGKWSAGSDFRVV